MMIFKVCLPPTTTPSKDNFSKGNDDGGSGIQENVEGILDFINFQNRHNRDLAIRQDHLCIFRTAHVRHSSREEWTPHALVAGLPVKVGILWKSIKMESS